MTRAAFISAGGDPFITLLVLKLFQERWYDEVDKVYIDYNNHAQVPLDVVSEFLDKAIQEPKVQLIYHPNGIGNGMPITEMTQIAKEELVLLLEDDGFIFESGAVHAAFQDIEKDLCDALGSGRGSCGQEIWDASKEKYGLDYSGEGDVGPNFWPNFFFCKRTDLLQTDLNFASVTFKPGDYCKELDYTFKGINHGDTFVWMCMQLRALGLRFHNVPQYHASPYEIEEHDNKRLKWAENASLKWIHGGSLSTSWNGYLSGSSLPNVEADISKQEIETRVAFWTIASDVIDGFDNFKTAYKEGINKLIDGCKLNMVRINRKKDIYRTLMRL